MQDSSSISMDVLFAGNVQLATPPEVFIKLNQVIDDPNKSLQDAAHLIEHDPGLSARLLKIVNSAFFGFPSKITSIQQAIVLIGTQQLRDLVLATLVVERFSSLPGGLISMRQFWTMSVRCALIAKFLALSHPDSKRLSACFISGLLHEIGRLVIYQRIPELARAAILLSGRENMPETEAERQIIGFDHYQVGAELARRWRLPQVIIVTIEQHDYPEAASTFVIETGLVVLAHHLSGVDCNDRDLMQTLFPADDPLWARIGLPRNLLDQILAEADQAFLEVFTQIFRG